jgi:hypothetical protein
MTAAEYIKKLKEKIDSATYRLILEDEGVDVL